MYAGTSKRNEPKHTLDVQYNFLPIFVTILIITFLFVVIVKYRYEHADRRVLAFKNILDIR